MQELAYGESQNVDLGQSPREVQVGMSHMFTIKELSNTTSATKLQRLSQNTAAVKPYVEQTSEQRRVLHKGSIPEFLEVRNINQIYQMLTNAN